MASITVVNLTNTLLNSATSALSVTSSVHNAYNPGEFYVHSAGGIYDLKLAYFTGPNTLYHENWEKIGEILFEVGLDLISLGLSFIGVGEAIQAGWRAAKAMQGAWAALGAGGKVVFALTKSSLRSVLGLAAADSAGLGLTFRSVVVKDAPEELEWTNISGYDDIIFKITGGATIAAASDDPTKGELSYVPLKAEKITQAEFKRLQKELGLYEMNPDGLPIYLDERDRRYYDDTQGRRIFDPGGREYYLDSSNNKKYLDQANDPPLAPYGNTTKTKELTGNDSGSWARTVFTQGSRTNVLPVQGFEVRNQSGHGLINIRALYDLNRRTDWVRDEMGDSAAITAAGWCLGKDLHIIDVREEEGFGVIDFRLRMSNDDRKAQWLIGNDYNKDKTRLWSFTIPEDKIVVGVQGKEQGKFGIVDVRFVLADKPR